MATAGRSNSSWAAIALAALLATAVLAPAATAKKGPKKKAPRLEFRGQAIIPTGTSFQGTTVGGLSSISYAGGETFYVISDDQANARFYSLTAAIADGQLSNGDITFRSVTTLRQPNGTPYPTGSLDPEGFTLTKHSRRAVVTSEGFANTFVPPWIRVYRLDGTYVRDLPLPDKFIPAAGQTRGVRQNLGFESAATRGKLLYAGTEAGLQNEPPPTLTATSPAHLLRYDVKRNRLQKEWIYPVDPIAEPFVGFGVNGLVEVLPLGKHRLITMERSFSVGAPGTGNKIKLYLTELRKDGSTSKSLLLNLDALGLPLDNVEGMALGPRLRGGRRTLLLVSDNNFAANQFTQFLLFAIGGGKSHH